MKSKKHAKDVLTVTVFAAASLFLAAAMLFAVGEEGANVEKTISGRVIDSETGKPLVGANVFAPNTTLGTTTDKDGDLRLRATSDIRSILVSFIHDYRRSRCGGFSEFHHRSSGQSGHLVVGDRHHYR